MNCLYNASAAAYYCGVRLIAEEVREAPERPLQVSGGFRRPDGRPFWVDTEEAEAVWRRLTGGS